MLDKLSLGLELYRTYTKYKSRLDDSPRFIVKKCTRGWCIKEKQEIGGYLPVMTKVNDEYDRLVFDSQEDAEAYKSILL